jgi:hypothetical protein
VARFLARSMVSRDSLFANNKSFLMFRVAVRLCCQSPVVLYALADAVTNKRHMDYWALQYAAANVHVLCLRSVAIVAHYPIASATRSTPPMLGYALFQLCRQCRHMRPNTARQTAMMHSFAYAFETPCFATSPSCCLTQLFDTTLTQYIYSMASLRMPLLRQARLAALSGGPSCVLRAIGTTFPNLGPTAVWKRARVTTIV